MKYVLDPLKSFETLPTSPLQTAARTVATIPQSTQSYSHRALIAQTSGYLMLTIPAPHSAETRLQWYRCSVIPRARWRPAAMAARSIARCCTAIGERPLVKSGPTTSTDGTPQPATGLIVQFDGNNWRDETGAIADGAGTIYNTLIPFSLPDYDVFTLSTTNSPAVIDRISGVGTTLFNMVVNPVNGTLYVSNTEALNVNRFEGHGHSHSTVRGNFARSRVTLINGTTTTPRDLNTHLDHTQPAATAAERQLSVAQPLGMAVSADGQDLYVAAFGSQKIAVYNTTALANGNFNVSDANQITLSAGGPTGVVLDDPRNRLYALTRFDNSVAVVDTQTRTQTATVPLFNPEPAIIKEGRKFLYDATSTSSHGDSSCAMCHVFGDLDALAWDLGNPDASVADNPNTFAIGLGPSGQPVFHPLKGPMTTQSLRGMANAGPMHWRGDRTGSGAVAGETVERAAFREFNGAFPELLGRNAPLSNGDIDAFARFALTINYPPNPIRALDNSLTASQSNGRNIYMIESTTGVIFTCNHCHTVAPVDGHFGTSGLSSVEGPAISQEFKVPHLRNMYTKVGKFGNSGIFSPTSGDKGPQIRGFGFMHDGNMDTLDNFLQGSVFRFSADTRENNQKRSDVINFVMAMDSEMAPIVGQQITLTANTGSDTDARLQLLQQRALVTQPRAECDLIAKGVIDGRMRGYLLTAENQFRSDKQGETVTLQQLRSEARKPDGAITFTCVPPASGTWMGIDRDDNGVLDND